jgi:hypothetical protein
MALAFVSLLAWSVGASAQTIATVNSEPVTRADLDRVRNGHTDASLGSSLVDLINERVLVQRGKSLGYAFSDQQYEATLQNVKRVNGLTSDAQLDAALESDHLTRAQLRSNWEGMAISSRVLGTEGTTRVPDEDARRYFESHPDEFPLQSFESAKPDVLARLTTGKTAHDIVFQSYLQLLRSEAKIVWTDADLQRAYEQAAR